MVLPHNCWMIGTLYGFTRGRLLQLRHIINDNRNIPSIFYILVKESDALGVKIDRFDRAILHELQLDGRLSNTLLAEKVNLSESSCLRRTRKLEEIGLLRGYVGLVDQSAAGYPDNVFVRITLHSQQQDDLAEFEAAVRQLPEVMECYLMSGDADYLLRVIVADARDYERIHSQALTRLPGVARVHSSFTLRTVIKKTELPIR